MSTWSFTYDRSNHTFVLPVVHEADGGTANRIILEVTNNSGSTLNNIGVYLVPKTTYRGYSTNTSTAFEDLGPIGQGWYDIVSQGTYGIHMRLTDDPSNDPGAGGHDGNVTVNWKKGIKENPVYFSEYTTDYGTIANGSVVYIWLSNVALAAHFDIRIVT